MPIPLFRHRSRTTGASSSATEPIWDGSAGDEDWSNGTNWSTSVAPVSKDYAILSTGSQDVSTGLGQSAVNLNAIYIGEDWTGTLDQLSVNAAKVAINKRTGSVSLNGILDEVTIYNTDAGSAAVALDGTIRNLRILGTRGTVTIAASAALTTVDITPSKHKTAQLSIGASVTGLTTINAGGRTEISLASSCTTVNLTGSATLKTTGTAAITTLNMGDESTLLHQS
jgi:hypothetical protein